MERGVCSASEVGRRCVWGETVLLIEAVFFGKGHRNIVGFGSLSKFKSFQTYFMTMNFSPAGIYVHHVCLMDPQELVMDGCEPPWACWSLN